MPLPDLIAALLLPAPPWVGFWIFRRKGRIGLSYGYFLGGLLTLLAFPWHRVAASPVATAQLGSALLGFTLFLQAQREGVDGPRRLLLGVGASTALLALMLVHLQLPWTSVARFWVGALVEALAWALLSDLAYRLTRGRQLEVRMPLVGLLAAGCGTLLQGVIWPELPRLAWPTALLGGLLLGLVAAQQLRWLREQGAWVEGRGEGLRLALGVLEQTAKADAPPLSLGLEAQQPMWLVDAQGRILESNSPFGQLAGLPRHRLRGYAMDALFQGGDTPVWEGLRQQLLRRGGACLAATQVSSDGSFRQVRLEASPFDRGMTLVWMSDPSPGSLQLVGGLPSPGPGEDPLRLGANALTALQAGLARLRGAAAPGLPAGLLDDLATASLRLDTAPKPHQQACLLDGAEALGALLPELQSLLPPGGQLQLKAEPLALGVEQATLARILRHLVLHALERVPEGRFTVRLVAVTLGLRPFALLHLDEGSGRPRPIKAVFGLGWLRQAVLEAGGLVELDQDPQAGLRPRVYLPAGTVRHPPADAPLAGRCIWIVDRDPLVRRALEGLVGSAGGTALGVEDLRALLKASRDQPRADALVLERSAQLERFHRALRGFQREAIPTLVMGLGQPLPLNPGGSGFRRLGFLDKPFSPDAFLEALLALLHDPGQPARRLL